MFCLRCPAPLHIARQPSVVHCFVFCFCGTPDFVMAREWLPEADSEVLLARPSSSRCGGRVCERPATGCGAAIDACDGERECVWVCSRDRGERLGLCSVEMDDSADGGWLWNGDEPRGARFDGEQSAGEQSAEVNAGFCGDCAGDMAALLPSLSSASFFTTESV